MIDKKRMYDVMVRMVEAPSISGTADEMSAVDRIEELLYEIPYFAAHRENVMRVPLQDDPLDRELICAYLELAPDCPDTIILTGGFAFDKELMGWISEYVSFVAPVTVYPGEDEMQALAQGGIRVLKGEEEAQTY